MHFHYMFTIILVDHLGWPKKPRQRNPSLIKIAGDLQGFEQTGYALLKAQAL